MWGLNTYLYGPKDDLKHRLLWREVYSAEEEGMFKYEGLQYFCHYTVKVSALNFLKLISTLRVSSSKNEISLLITHPHVIPNSLLGSTLVCQFIIG